MATELTRAEIQEIISRGNLTMVSESTIQKLNQMEAERAGAGEPSLADLFEQHLGRAVAQPSRRVLSAHDMRP